MTFGLAMYFDKLDLAEAVAHELALAAGAASGTVPPWSEVPLRALVGDPFDLRRRFVVPDIQTLTLRRTRSTGQATFVLHWRDPARVATTGGIYGLVPTGEFQPSTTAGRDRVNDFDLWRNIVREYSEEILGEPERDGSSGALLDYENWDLYRTLQQAREGGRVSVFCLGVGLDALTLAASVLSRSRCSTTTCLTQYSPTRCGSTLRAYWSPLPSRHRSQTGCPSPKTPSGDCFEVTR